MVRLQTARVADLQPGDWATIQCSCGHETFVPPYVLRGLRLAPDAPVTELASILGCRSCGGMGSTVVSVRWAAA